MSESDQVNEAEAYEKTLELQNEAAEIFKGLESVGLFAMTIATKRCAKAMVFCTVEDDADKGSIETVVRESVSPFLPKLYAIEVGDETLTFEGYLHFESDPEDDEPKGIMDGGLDEPKGCSVLCDQPDLTVSLKTKTEMASESASAPRFMVVMVPVDELTLH